MFVTCTTELTYKNSRDMSLKLAPFSLFWCEKCEEITDNNINSEPQSGIDGETFIGSRLDVRKIVLTGFINDRRNIKVHKTVLTKVLNPTLPGKLTHFDLATRETRYIDVRVDSIPSVVWKGNQARFDIELIALSPFWLGGEVTETVALLTPLFKFPVAIKSLAAGGFVFGRRSQTLESTFENVGDTNTGFRAMLRAKSGTVTNPIIINKNTGEMIKINYHMLAGDIMEMIIYPHIKRIIINKTVNGFQYLNLASVFFTLDVGINNIAYDADVNVSNLEVVVYYVPRYL